MEAKKTYTVSGKGFSYKTGKEYKKFVAGDTIELSDARARPLMERLVLSSNVKVKAPVEEKEKNKKKK